MEGSDTSRLWRHRYCPFDAIGFPPADLGPLPISQAAFEKAVNYARIVTWRFRLASRASTLPPSSTLSPPPSRDSHPHPPAQVMPFADYHVEEAVRYFTQNDPSGRLSGVAWEWAFQDSIVQQNQCCYTRSWAPELVWEDRVLEQDVVVYDLRPKLAASGVAVPGPHGTTSSLVSDVDEGDEQREHEHETGHELEVEQSQPNPANQEIPLDLINPRIDCESRPGQQTQACSLEQLQQDLLLQLAHERAQDASSPSYRSPASLPSNSANRQTPESRGRQKQREQQRQQHRQQQEQQQQRRREQSDPLFDERYIPSRQSNASWRFVGFHREQVHLAGEFVTKEWDYRQTVWRHLDINNGNGNSNQQQQDGGRAAPYWIMTKYNMVGQLVPATYRFQQPSGDKSSVKPEDILFREGCSAEGGSASEQEQDSSIPNWIPTPAEPEREAGENTSEPRRSRRKTKR